MCCSRQHLIASLMLHVVVPARVAVVFLVRLAVLQEELSLAVVGVEVSA